MKEYSETADQKKKFTEGDEFYYENGFMVLTEKFLRERGYCCDNSCRHCPYGEVEITASSE